MSWLSDRMGTSAQHGPSSTQMYNSAMGTAASRFAPISAALTAQYKAKEDPLKRNVLGSFASRGFGLSGMANQGIAQALAENNAAMEDEKRKAQAEIYGQEQERAARQYAQQNAEMAGKRQKFLGIF